MQTAIQETNKELEEYYEQFYEGAKAIIQSVLRRALILVIRYAQFLVNDLNDRGLKVKMVAVLNDTKTGVKVTMELIPCKERMLDALKSKAFRKLVKRCEKEAKKMRRGVIVVCTQAGDSGTSQNMGTT